MVVAGRRFGKTFLSVSELLQVAVNRPDSNCWYIAPTYRAAKDIAWQMLCDSVPEIYIAKRNETELTLKLVNGSTISLKGAENADSLRGRSLDFCVLDEFADMKPTAWSEVIRPSLSDRHSEGNPTRALFIGTPKGVGSAFYDLWQKGNDKENGWQSFQYTTLEGGNVPDFEVEAAKRDLDARTFKQEYEASFVTYSGVIYYNFDRRESVKDCPFDWGDQEDTLETRQIRKRFNAV